MVPLGKRRRCWKIHFRRDHTLHYLRIALVVCIAVLSIRSIVALHNVNVDAEPAFTGLQKPQQPLSYALASNHKHAEDNSSRMLERASSPEKFLRNKDAGSKQKQLPAKDSLENLLHNLTTEYEERHAQDSNFTKHLTLPNFLVRRRISEKLDVTLVTQASIDKLSRLKDLLQRWDGPISCAVYMTTTQHIEMWWSLVTSSPQLSRQVSFHVLLETPTGLRYPINRLRNLALGNVESDYVLCNDMDFIPDAGAYQSLRSKLQDDVSLRGNKTLWVLPAFERFGVDGRGKGRFVNDVSLVPQSKEILVDMVKKELVKPFHEYFRPGHGPTNYSRWYSEKGIDSYPITYQYLFEPYVVAFRPGLPLYYENFRGFGHNKMTWFVELHQQGYSFRVLVDHFVCHMNHPGRKGRRDKGGDSHIQKARFQEYMHERYNVPWSELNKWK